MRRAWTKLSKNVDPTAGYFKTRLHTQFSKGKLDDRTGGLEDWITDIELLSGYL